MDGEQKESTIILRPLCGTERACTSRLHAYLTVHKRGGSVKGLADPSVVLRSSAAPRSLLKTQNLGRHLSPAELYIKKKKNIDSLY